MANSPQYMKILKNLCINQTLREDINGKRTGVRDISWDSPFNKGDVYDHLVILLAVDLVVEGVVGALYHLLAHRADLLDILQQCYSSLQGSIHSHENYIPPPPQK